MANIFERFIDWVRRKLRKPKPRKVRVKLLEPFKDFKVVIRSYSKDPSRKTVRTIKPQKYPFDLTLKKLQKAVKKLQKRYPQHNYRMKEVEVEGILFHVVRRGKTGLKNPPLYFQLEWGRIFVPSSYHKRKKRLTNSVIHYRLHSLGLV